MVASFPASIANNVSTLFTVLHLIPSLFSTSSPRITKEPISIRTRIPFLASIFWSSSNTCSIPSDGESVSAISIPSVHSIPKIWFTTLDISIPTLPCVTITTLTLSFILSSL